MMKRLLLSMIVFAFTLAMSASVVNSMLGGKRINCIDNSQRVLPDGLVAVEYLESTGTQYIDGVYFYTGIESSINIEVDFSVQRQSPTTQNFVFSGSPEPYFPRLGVFNDTIGVTCDSMGVVRTMRMPLQSRHVIAVQYSSPDRLYVEMDNSKSQSGTRSFHAPIGVVARLWHHHPNYCGRARIYGFKLAIDGIVVRDMVPVKFNEVGCMYDFVQDELLGNAGQGEFLIGPDV